MPSVEVGTEIGWRMTEPSLSRFLANSDSRSCEVREFALPQRGDRFLDNHPGRYVVKFNGPDRRASSDASGRR